MGIMSMFKERYLRMADVGEDATIVRLVDAVKFTDSDKDRIFNELTGQYAPAFENGRPVLKVTNSAGQVVVVRIGDWLCRERYNEFVPNYFVINGDVEEVVF